MPVWLVIVYRCPDLAHEDAAAVEVRTAVRCHSLLKFCTKDTGILPLTRKADAMRFAIQRIQRINQSADTAHKSPRR